MRSRTHTSHVSNIELARRICLAVALTLAVVSPTTASGGVKINKVMDYIYTPRANPVNAAARQPRGITTSLPYNILQMFLMGIRGAGVAMIHKTREYWHGKQPWYGCI